MKKSTFLLTIAAMSAITASASVEAVGLRAADQDLVSSKSTFTVPAATVKNLMNAPLKISSVSDIFGFYEYATYDWINKTPYTLGPNIEAGSSSNEVLIKNMPYSDIDVIATVNTEADKLILKPFDTGMYLSQYGENIQFTPFKFVPAEEEGYMNLERVKELELSILADGTIEFPVTVVGKEEYPSGFMYEISQGQFCIFASGNLVPIKFFEFKADEWKSVGKGKYTESVLNTLLEKYSSPVAAYDVDVMANKENEDIYLIVDPYKGTRFDDASIGLTNMSPNASGYIMIDASYPDCILVQPLVGSGFGYVLDEEGNWSDMMIFNMEAMMVRQGYTPEDVMYEYGGNEESCSYMEDNTMYFYHMRFTFASNPLGIYTWTDLEMREGSLVLDPAGVEGIEADSNAPVKFYNLQGVEIANPEKGQLVIKKQGSNAQKMIVK